MVFNPKVFKTTPNSGSEGGGVIEVNILGVGTENSLDDLVVVDASSNSICTETKIIGFETLTCKLAAGTFSD